MDNCNVIDLSVLFGHRYSGAIAGLVMALLAIAAK